MREASSKGSVPSPSIKPKQDGGARSNRNRGPYAEDWEELYVGLPELGAPGPLTEGEWLAMWVFLLDDAEP